MYTYEFCFPRYFLIELLRKLFITEDSFGAVWKQVFKHINGLRNRINIYYFKIEKIVAEKLEYEKNINGLQFDF